MKKTALIISGLSLSICAITPFLSFFTVISFNTYMLWFNISSIFWFLSAPLWMIPGKTEH